MKNAATTQRPRKKNIDIGKRGATRARADHIKLSQQGWTEVDEHDNSQHGRV